MLCDEGGRGDPAQQLVHGNDLLLQQEVLLLGPLLPLLRHLQGLHELRVLHVQVLQEQVRLGVLGQLTESTRDMLKTALSATPGVTLPRFPTRVPGFSHMVSLLIPN